MQQIAITFLGTSSATPTADRNMAAVAISLDGDVLLFDCGEATQHQLLRSPVSPSAIEAIFLSHLHGDHLYGLPGLIATLGLNGRSRPLVVYGPPGLAPFISAIPYRGAPYPLEVRVAGEHRADGYRIVAAPLDHTVPCFGYCIIEDDRPGRFDVERARALGIPEGPLFGALQHGSLVTLPDARVVSPSEVLGPNRPGRRIAYCTDTRPCAAAVDLARGADVLIHESTYAEELRAEAAERGHSTARDAAQIAAAAGVRQLVLTHFSSRYRDVEPLAAEAREIFPNTIAAADFARFEVTR